MYCMFVRRLSTTVSITNGDEVRREGSFGSAEFNPDVGIQALCTMAPDLVPGDQGQKSGMTMAKHTYAFQVILYASLKVSAKR
jgi:hypothetical protein